MKQQVNLYQARLYTVKQPLSLSRLVFTWAALVLMMLLLGFVLQQKQQRQLSQLNTQQQQLDLQLQEVALFQQALTQRQPSAQLAKQLHATEQSVLQKQRLLSYLTLQQQQASQFYSPILLHLQQIDQQDIWLTGFELQQQRSNFRGIALRPDRVPLWLEDLRQLGYFRGQHFNQVQMQQVPDKRAVAFELAAKQEAGQ